MYVWRDISIQTRQVVRQVCKLKIHIYRRDSIEKKKHSKKKKIEARAQKTAAAAARSSEEQNSPKRGDDAPGKIPPAKLELYFHGLGGEIR